MAESEHIKELKDIMRDPLRIRNICTSAHIHHGKCISKDARLVLADGSIKTAEELYQLAEKTGKKFEEKDEHTIYDLSQQNISLFSLNKETGRLEQKRIDLAWKLQGGKLIKIKLRNGFEIATTPEHKFITFEHMQFVEKPAVDLKLGDNIVCARSLKVTSKINIKQEMLTLLRKENFYVYLKEEFAQALKKKILAYGVKNIVNELSLSVKEKSFYHGLWQDRMFLDDLLRVCRFFDIKSIYDSIDTIVYRGGKQKGHNSLPLKLPQNFENFFYLAGLFLGDGTFKRFIVGKEELRGEFIRLCHEINCNATPKNDPDRTPALETNKTLLYMLHTLFDYPLRQKSKNIHISSLVWKCPNEYIGRLLRGYFDTDGTVEISRSAISITSASPQMIKDLSLLLLRLGIVPIINNDTIYISGFSVAQYNKHIGFKIKFKQERAINLESKSVGSYVTDWVNVTESTRVSPLNQQGLVQLGLQQGSMSKFFNEDIVYLQIASLSETYESIVYDFTIPDHHNFITDGFVIHNTALTDNLLAAAGHLSVKAAGSLEEGMATWQHKDEQERLLTVDAANVSMIHEFHHQKYLINLIDTPGHVDFGGNVTRAMRAIDGTIVLVCAVEGIMPQTETVIRQALKERVKPVLFINKVDRLINELKFTPEKIQERFAKLVIEFNRLIERMAEQEFKEKWKVNIQDGSVAFGSARENWALSLPYMKKRGVNFKDIIALYQGGKTEEEQQKWIWDHAPLFEVLLDIVITHLPNPKEAQAYRIPHIWKGDLDSPLGKDLLSCNPNGKIAFVVTRITIDPRFGREMAAGRLFSGTIKEGQTVYLNQAKMSQRIAQVFMYRGIKPESLDAVPSGNVLALGGITANAGDTITSEPEHPFEELKHIFEPVITKAIEPVRPQDLPKLVEVLRKVAKEDPSIKIEINPETGENLMSGMGELHLEIIENRITTEKNLQVKTSEPIVVYRETIQKKSQEFEGKSPNKHNKFYIQVEPIDDPIYFAIKSGEIPEGRIKKDSKELTAVMEKYGVTTKEARKIRAIFNGNMLIDNTRGIVHIGEVIEYCLDAFEQVMKEGPLAREPCVKVRVIINDTKLHEDAIHRGPAQVLPAVRSAIKEAMLDAGATMFEPVQVLMIDCPTAYMAEISKLVQNKRGQLLEINQEGEHMDVRAKLPVGETLGLASDLRSATSGRGNYFLVDQMFERLPSELQPKIIAQIRQRKGLKVVDEDIEQNKSGQQ